MEKDNSQDLLMDTTNTDKKKKKYVLSKGFRFILFLVMIAYEGVICISSGLISSSSKVIKSTLKLNDKEFGFFGVSNSLGRFLGSMINMYLNQKVNKKWLFVSFVSLKAIFIFSFKLTSNGYLLIILRLFIGICHMPPSIYVPCWIDQYGFSSYKNIQMSSLQLVQPGGKLLGYFLHVLVGNENWQNGFVIESICLVVISFIIIVSPGKYFLNNLTGSKEIDEESRATIFVEEKHRKISDFEQDTNILKDMVQLFKNSIYISGMITRALILGINTGLHFWISDYMRTVLNVMENKFIFYSYSAICIFGPLGAIIVNSIFKSFIGKYDSKRSSYSLLFFYLCTCLCGVGIAFAKNIKQFILITCGYFLFESCSVPLLQGALIIATGKRLANSGTTVAAIITQLFTSGPSSVMYGAINDKYKDRYPWLAMFCLMIFNFISFPSLLIMTILRNKKFDSEEQNNNKEIENSEKLEGKELEDKN